MSRVQALMKKLSAFKKLEESRRESSGNCYTKNQRKRLRRLKRKDQATICHRYRRRIAISIYE